MAALGRKRLSLCRCYDVRRNQLEVSATVLLLCVGGGTVACTSKLHLHTAQLGVSVYCSESHTVTSEYRKARLERFGVSALGSAVVTMSSVVIDWRRFE